MKQITIDKIIYPKRKGLTAKQISEIMDNEVSFILSQNPTYTFSEIKKPYEGKARERIYPLIFNVCI